MALNNNLPSRQRELQVLQRRIQACRQCQEQGYIPCAQPIVNGRAYDHIFIIGQAPGHRSVANNMPWSGPAGHLLQRWLESAGFPSGFLYEHAYLSSLTHCDPGKSPRGNGDRKPSPQEVALCRPFLNEELLLVQPRVVLLVGTMAIEAFFARRKLEDLIGTYEERDGRLWLPLPHPSGVSRWLNDTQHQQLLHIALQHLAEWRIQYGL
ncbi:uracil-DNA glycosylase family protein [Ktedonospora formicarum]|uniref:Uracil-DNA glycosylase n=1 Tax=Ktedonospora formicarum TaxID=2778364 RepID=A0A8J3MXR7_9CHLR|nr:uracil-DNA glycosylase family protein [Ktedonospora formicarum]GHO50276.1 uracil-DNA glycosylase [Ktedonospora formicarum]